VNRKGWWTRIFLFALLLMLFLVPQTLAIDRVIVNSQDWHDVFSGMLYGSLQGVPSNFLVSQKHGSILLYSISSDEDDLLVVSSRQQPYFVGYEPFLQGRGYSNAEEVITRNANLDLAERLEGISRFIIIDPVYGYNAISAAPYAVVSQSYILFADRRNIDEIVDFLDTSGATDILLFGQLDREVKEALAQYNPEIVNEGDRFANNVAMVDRYLEINPTRQAILTNGEFIESGMMNGEDPVVYIGRANVPETVREYITNSDIEVGILIGNELIGAATTVRRTLGISVFVKFAQGSRVPQGAIAQVEDLDRFPMPLYDVLLEITSVVYNKATRSLEVTYRNPTDLALFFRSTSIQIDDGGVLKQAADNTPIFLDKGATKTVVYAGDLEGNPLLLEGTNLIARIFTIFGESPTTLDRSLEAEFRIEQVEINDEAQVNITGLYYDKGKQQFMVTIENTGDVDAYVQPEIVNLLINDEFVTVAADRPYLVPAGGKVKIPIPIEMIEEDFLENPQIRVRAYYGEREIALTKVTEKSFALEFGTEGGNIVYYVVVVVLVIILLLLWLGTKKKCKQCGHKNPRGRKKCEKCGARL
jgi:hypothetical protein